MNRSHQKMLYYCFLSIPLFVFEMACDDATPPLSLTPHHAQTIFLDKENSTTTELWFRLRITATNDRGTIKIIRDEQTTFANIDRGRAGAITDTMLYESGLLPKRTYTYKAYRVQNNIPIDSSNALMIRTMDTTSHDFAWTKFEIGEYPSSSLNDICIINDSCAYAVGEIYSRDTTGELGPLYNVAKWDGSKWNFIRIQFRLDYGSTVIITDQDYIKTTFAITKDDIWFVSGSGGVTRFLNNKWIMVNVPYGKGPGAANKIWGSDSNNIYFVGNLGKLTMYQQGQWKRLPTGTSLPINDIWGAENPKTGEMEILAVASEEYLNTGKHILKINGDQVTPVSTNGLSWSERGIWFVPGNKYYTVGDGIYFTQNGQGDSTKWLHDPGASFTNHYSKAVRGISIIDVVVVCAFGDILHFNGQSWKNFEPQTRLGSGAYNHVAIQENLIVAVGENNGRGVIAMGRRTQP